MGRCISDLVIHEHEFNHTIVLLERPKNTAFLEKVKAGTDAEIFITPEREELNRLLATADVVIVHWWHNPQTCRFLLDFPEAMKSRVILWSHVSGCNYPYLSPELMSCFDRIFITSPCSLDNSFWADGEREMARRKFRLVYGLGAMKYLPLKSNYTVPDFEFRIAYTGTFAKSKIHPDFVQMCRCIIEKIPTAVFYMFGDEASGCWIREDAAECGIGEHFIFTGFVTDVPARLAEMDIFGYPLNPLNFATTENSLLEAMSVGLPVVCMRQGTEKYIINNNVDGLLAGTEEEYIEDVARLAGNKEERQLLGSTAAGTVKKRFDFETNVRNFEEYIDEELQQPARTYNFKQAMGNTPYEWFFSAVNPKDRGLLEAGMYAKLPDIFREKSKGSVEQFAEVFEQDFKLKNLSLEICRGE